MRNVYVCITAVVIATLGMGCETAKTRAPEGALIGGVLGAAAGGIIGHQSGHGGEGAAIGAAAGAVTGAIVGNQIEKPGQPAQAAQGANPNQMSLQDIVNLAKQGASENAIIEKIRLTNSKFSLSAAQVDYLKQQGVSQKVIDAMQAG